MRYNDIEDQPSYMSNYGMGLSFMIPCAPRRVLYSIFARTSPKYVRLGAAVDRTGKDPL